jgi:hypothetical protein
MNATELAELDDPRLRDRARRAARSAGLVARRSRKGWSIDNYLGFMLIDPYNNSVVAGVRFDLSVADVIRMCSE